MPKISSNPQVKAILLPKELLLYEAVQSRMAYAVPSFLVLLGLLLCFPGIWAFLEQRPKLAPLYGHAYHLFYEMKFALVFIAFGLGAAIARYRSARSSHHFVTNLRVVEQSKTLLHNDVQYILLHHIKLVKVKAGPMQLLTFTGTMVLEDDMGYEHIEIPNVASPRDFKKAIFKAKDRFAEVAMRAEKDGVLKQVQSDKSKREKKKQQRVEQRKQRQKEAAEKRRIEEENQRRQQDSGGY